MTAFNNLTKPLFFGAFLSILINNSCNNNNTEVSNSQNDTIKVLKILIDSTFKLPRLADVHLLYKNNPFGDRVIVRSDTLLNLNLPIAYKFKFLTQDSICKLAEQYKDSTDFPNYLEFEVIKKSDSTYEASIINMRIENQSNCLIVINDGCLKYMTFRKKGNILIPTIVKTLYDK